MRIVVTGGTGVVGTGTVTELLRRGHTVVLVSRHAEEEARQWRAGVIAKACDVTDATQLRGAAEGCEAVLHMAGIVEESPPEVTFASVNVNGTTNMIAEARRAGVKRFVYLSSLGAERGASAYHRSKHEAERVVRGFRGAWTICRPGNVYGPGDGQISMLLRLVRGASPIVPKIGDGEQPFQPIWWEDAAYAIAEVVERDDLAHAALDLAGVETTCQNDLIRRFSAITGRDIHAIPLPEFIATLGAKAVSLIGWDIGFTDDQLQMLREGNFIPAGRANALTDILDVEPTPLDDGLRALCNLQPEQLSNDGIGSLKRKRYWADIARCNCTPETLFTQLLVHFNDVMPVFVDAAVEPTSSNELREGAVLTLSLPMRGHVQVRVTALEERSVALITLVGHPLAGAVRFLSERRGDGVRFQIEVYDRAANLIDLVAMRTLGDRLQNHTWEKVVENVVERSGGVTEAGVESDSETLDEEQAAQVGKWLEELVLERKREENAETIAGG
ncbi:MAG: NAD-dependent epimerase/dehydratase family protein [bacterium]